MTITLYDAERCPFCARVRILLAEKGIEYETVVIDLEDRPAWLYEKNPLGKVPVLEEDTFVLPESPVIMEYLEERYPEPSFLPSDPAARALIRLAIERFDANLGSAYYAFRRGEDGADERLAHLPGVPRPPRRRTVARIHARRHRLPALADAAPRPVRGRPGRLSGAERAARRALGAPGGRGRARRRRRAPQVSAVASVLPPVVDQVWVAEHLGDGDVVLADVRVRTHMRAVTSRARSRSCSARRASSPTARSSRPSRPRRRSGFAATA